MNVSEILYNQVYKLMTTKRKQTDTAYFETCRYIVKDLFSLSTVMQ